MSPHPSYPRTRLYLTQMLAQGVTIALDEKASHYLAQVLRRKTGDTVALFNGRDGEWLAAVETVAKKSVTLAVQSQLRLQGESGDIWLLPAPLKNSRTEWVVEKATELGVARICPVSTQLTVVDRINETRLTAIAVEAAEQCERLDVPEITSLATLEKLILGWQPGRTLLYGDESGMAANAGELLPALGKGSFGLLIGPEGGFSASELAMLRGLPYVKGVCLGPRVLRADTAAIAALSLVQAFCGDWEQKPAFRRSDQTED